MATTRNAIGLRLWVLIAATAILLAILVQARPVLAPGPALIPAAPAAHSEASSNPAVQRTITATTNPPATAPKAPTVTQQPALEVPQSPSSAQCPTKPGSGLPCRKP